MCCGGECKKAGSMRKLDGKKLIIATHNDGKLREMEDLLAPFGYELQSLKQLGLPVPEETGTRFEQNAYIKAAAAAKVTGLPALSDDSGLEVDILMGAPGVYTADWAEQPDGSRDFGKAMQQVEDEVEAAIGDDSYLSEGEMMDRRRARFISVLCLAWPDGHAEYFRGQVEGYVIWPPRGDKGFGYDPMFQPAANISGGHEAAGSGGEYAGKTFGEMTAEEKHGWKPWDAQALSHRARAFKLFAEAMLK